MKNLENYGVQEMDSKEMKKTDGGRGWGDLLWSFAKEIAEGYVNLSAAIINYHIETEGEYVPSKMWR